LDLSHVLPNETLETIGLSRDGFLTKDACKFCRKEIPDVPRITDVHVHEPQKSEPPAERNLNSRKGMSLAQAKLAAMSALGQKRTCAVQLGMSALCQ